MTGIMTCCLFGAILCVNARAAETLRVWKDAGGKVLAEGEFISLDDGNVCIQTKAGTGKMIPIEALCQEDRDFAENNGDDLSKIEGTIEEPEVIGGGKTVKNDPGNRAGNNAGKTDAGKATTESADTDLPNDDVEVETTATDIDGTTDSGDIQKKVRDEADQYARMKRVVMFDWESLFDKGDYGSRVGLGLWRKLNREGKDRFVIPESMQDVRTACEMINFKPNDKTSLEEMKKVVTGTFRADIGIWGKMERAPEHRWEVYDVWVKCYDFSTDPPTLIYEKSGRTEAVAEVMTDEGNYVGPMMKRLVARIVPEKSIDPEMEERWKTGPNIVVGGDFEKAKNGIPVGWESRGGQEREPVGNLIKWIPDPTDTANHIIRLDMPGSVAGSSGCMYYCRPFVVEEGATYRFQCRFRSDKPAGKVFIKCSDVLDSDFHPTPDALQEGYADKFGQQTREVYRSQQNLHVSKPGVWQTHTQDFTPNHTKYSPKFGRVMLFGFGDGGKLDFDDIVLKKIKDADPRELAKKVERHSLKTKTTIKEMEENERRMEEERRNKKEIRGTPKLK